MRRHGRLHREPAMNWGAVALFALSFALFFSFLGFTVWRAHLIADAAFSAEAMRSCLIWFGRSCA